MCAVCFFAANIATDFALSGVDNIAFANNRGEMCCRYGSNGVGTSGYDCAIVPGAINKAVAGLGNLNDRFCGRDAGIGKNTALTVCSKFSFNND